MSLSPRPTAQGSQGPLKVSAALHTPGPEGGGEGDGTDLTRGTKHSCTAPCGETSALGKEEGSRLGVGGGQEGRAPTPFSLQPEAQESMGG